MNIHLSIKEPCEVPYVARTPVKTYLSREELSILDRMTSTLGQSRSAMLRTAALAYAKDLNLLQEYIHHE